MRLKKSLALAQGAFSLQPNLRNYFGNPLRASIVTTKKNIYSIYATYTSKPRCLVDWQGFHEAIASTELYGNSDDFAYHLGTARVMIVRIYIITCLNELYSGVNMNYNFFLAVDYESWWREEPYYIFAASGAQLNITTVGETYSTAKGKNAYLCSLNVPFLSFLARFTLGVGLKNCKLRHTYFLRSTTEPFPAWKIWSWQHVTDAKQ